MALKNLTIAIVCTLSTAGAASATPLTLQFAGQWSHYATQQLAPAFWTDMAAFGIVNGTQALFTFSVDDALSGSDPANGRYMVTGWQLQLGRHTFSNTARPSSLSNGGFWGQASGAALGSYTPGFMQFGMGTSGLPVYGGLAGLSNARNWPATTLYFEFNGSFSRNGGTMSLRPLSVPEPSTLALALAGIAGGLWQVRRRRRE